MVGRPHEVDIKFVNQPLPLHQVRFTVSGDIKVAW